MAKVYPNHRLVESQTLEDGDAGPVVLTVWRKSLLFNCSGFTVFDTAGNLAFRVDSYSADTKNELVLMDAIGKPLLTLRRKKLSLGQHWTVYKGEEAVRPLFSAKRHVEVCSSKVLARVMPAAGGGGYVVEGSYSRRCCVVYGEGRRRVAEVRRKEAASGGVGFGDDVFRLVVQPGFDAAVGMAIVMLLEQMFGS